VFKVTEMDILATRFRCLATEWYYLESAPGLLKLSNLGTENIGA
jgi:hypothetical protein